MGFIYFSLSVYWTKEFYKYDYKELVKEIGEEEALKRVERYLKMSEQFAETTNFVVHNCKLLSSYAEQASKPSKE